MYNILEAIIEYKNGKLKQVTVLVEISKGDVRAIYISDSFQPGRGYSCFRENEPVSDSLLQKVAGYGKQTEDRDKLFRGWRRKYGYAMKK